MSRSRSDWLIFAALGFFWGSSYLFIKIGVETLTPFTLIAGRLAVGAALLAVVALRRAGPLPRERRMYGHLIVMGVLNIVIPFSLITWGETSIDSALASILKPRRPAVHDRHRVAGPRRRADHGQPAGRASASASAASSRITSRSFDPAPRGRPARRAGAHRVVDLVRGRQRLRPPQRAWPAADGPGVLPGLLRLPRDRLDPGVRRGAAARDRLDGLRRSSRSSGSASSARASPTCASSGSSPHWGSTRSSLVAYLLPVVGIVLGAFVLGETRRARVLLGTALVVGGVALVNSRLGQRRLFGGEDANWLRRRPLPQRPDDPRRDDPPPRRPLLRRPRPRRWPTDGRPPQAGDGEEDRAGEDEHRAGEAPGDAGDRRPRPW